MDVQTLPAPPAPPARGKAARPDYRTLAIWCAIGLVLGTSLMAGLAFRRATWEITKPIRFGDIFNGFHWAMESSGPQGYLNQYDKMALEEFNWSPWLDYAPLRLLVMDMWGHWVRLHYPTPADPYQRIDWQPAYAFNQPVLDFNTAMDALGAVCAFLLTRLWVIRIRRRENPIAPLPPFTGVLPGLVAALTLWFNPAMLLSAYGWPTWDAWIVPMYLLAALLASLDWWFAAGMTIAIGAMFKGQQLTVAPVFILWALMLGQLGSAARWAAGLIVGIAIVASPWLFSHLSPRDLALIQWTKPYSNYDSPESMAVRRIIEYPAMLWVIGVVALTAFAPLLAERIALRNNLTKPIEQPPFAPRPPRSFPIPHLVLAIAIFAATVWPWCLQDNRHYLWLGVILAAALSSAAFLLPRHALRYTAAVAGGTTALLCILVFHGSHAWWDCGIHYGTIHWQTMIMGHTDNLPGLLQVRYKWPDSALEKATTFPALFDQLPYFTQHHLWPAAPVDVTTKVLFDSIYTIMLLISGIGLGLQARRRDPRFLAALITPWVLFFTIPVQIHERYLLFAGGAAAICIGQSVGTWLLGLFLSFITLIMTLHVMLINGADIGDFGTKLSIAFPWLFSPDSGHTLFKYIDGSFPDAAWSVILAAGVFLYLSFAPTRTLRPTNAVT